VFATLSDRLAATFKNLRGKGRLSEADIAATAREIRIALLEADVALPVVKEFVEAVKTRARGTEVSGALNPAQQIVKIVNEELVTILGGETRRLRFAKNPPTVIMLAGLQGSGKTTLAAKLRLWLIGAGQDPAARGRRPPASRTPSPSCKVNGERAGRTRLRTRAGQRRRRPGPGRPYLPRRWAQAQAPRRRHRRHRRPPRRGRRDDGPRPWPSATRSIPTEIPLRRRRDDRPRTARHDRARLFPDGVGYDGVVLTKLDGDARGGAALSIASITGKPVMFASNGEKMTRLRLFHPDRMASRILDMG
jgi:signal recognition particle subunit SRP54